MIPISDAKSFRKLPLITILFIFLNTVLFFLFFSQLGEMILSYGFVPSDFNVFNLFSSIFIHASFWHLLVNMWFLWIFGSTLEDKIGRGKFFMLYIILGLLSNLIYFIFATSDLAVPIVGASGAISGILGAYLVLFPKKKIKTFPNFNLKAYVYIILWFALQIFFYFLGGGGIAFLGHFGGFLSGIILALLLK